MKAIHVQSEIKGNPLIWQEITDPTYGPDDVLIDIHATALNRADLMQRAGNYPVPPDAPDTLGLEAAGVITEVGGNVSGWQVGDRVCALVAGGGYAEQAAIPHQMLMPIPDSWSYVQAAAVPEVFFTAYVNLFMEANLQAGEVALVHGGSSGVGTAAIQMVREAGAKIIVTASTEDKLAKCRELGADLAINYKEQDFVEAVRDFTNGEGVDVVMDMVAAAYLERNLSLLKVRGRYVLISLLSGTTAEINLGLMMRRRLRLIGSVLRPRSLAEKIEIKERFMAQFWDAMLDGTIQPVIDSVYPVEEATAAQEYMRGFGNIGKVVLQVRGA